MTTTHSSDPALSQRLRRLWDQFQALLQAAAGSGELSLAIEGALNVDSSSSAVGEYLNLLAAGDKKSLESLPAVALADGEAMAGAAGAYVTDLNRILINSSWLATASDAEVIRVLAEEYGHSLDAKFNATDTPGDEGEKFAALLLGYEVPDSSAFENDSITVTVDGATYAAEAASTTLGSTAKSTGVIGSTIVSDDIFFTNSSTGTVSAAVHTIYTAGGLDKIVIDRTAAPRIDPGDSTGGNADKEVVIVRSVFQSTRTAGVFAEIRSVNYAATSIDSIYLDRNDTIGYSLTGNSLKNTIGGGPGFDSLFGAGGGDVLVGNARAPQTGTSSTASAPTVIGGDSYDPGGSGGQIWVNWTPPAESTVAALSALSAETSTNSTQLATTQSSQSTTIIRSSSILLYSNNDIINFPGYENWKAVNWKGAINQFDRNLYPLTTEAGWLIVNFIEKQGKVFIYQLPRAAGSTATEIANVQKKVSTVDMAQVFGQVFNTTALVPGQTVIAGQAPPPPTEGTFGAINEDTTLTITEADFPEAAIVNIFGPDGFPLPQTATPPLSWTYTPAKDFNGTVTLTADFGYYKQPYKLVIRPVNDEPVSTTAGEITSVNEDNNNADANNLWSTVPQYSPGPNTATDYEATNQRLSYKITAIPAFISLYKSDGTAISTDTDLTAAEFATLTYKTVPNANGTANITFDVIDSGLGVTGTNGEPNDNTLANQSVSIMVRPVNDEPVTTITGAIATVNEDNYNTLAAALWATPPVYGPGGGSDEISQTLSYKITAIPAFISLYKSDGTSVVSTGTVLNAEEFEALTYKTVPNANGTANITFDVIDSGPDGPGANQEPNDNTLANQSVSITVQPVSNPPVLTDTTDPAAVVELAKASAQDLAPITGSFALSDSDIGETLTVSIVDGPRVLLDGAPFTLPTDALALTAAGSFSVSPLTQPSTGGAATPISYIYDPGAANLNFLAQGKQLTITYQVQVSDGTTTSAIQDVTFTLTGTNDSPRVNGSSAIKIAPTTNSSDSGFMVSSLFSSSFSDIDNGDSLTGIAITGLVEPASSAGVWQRLSDENTWVSITAAGLSDTTARTLRLTDSLRFLGTSQGTTPTLKVLLIDSSTYPATSPNPGFTSPINWGTVDTTYQPLGPGTDSSPFSTSTINLQAQ